MPDYIDKTNAMEYVRANNVRGYALAYCEALTTHGNDEIPVDNLKLIENALSKPNAHFMVVDKTKQRQETRSYKVYIIHNSTVLNITNMIASLCRSDRDGNVKVNYEMEVDQMLKLISPYTTIMHF